MFSAKRVLFLVLLFSLTSWLVFSESLRFFDLDDAIYDEIDALFVMEGKSVPIAPRPWTEIDVERLLGIIEPSNDAAKRLYEVIESKILEKKGDFSGYIDIYFSPEMLIHSNPSEFNSYEGIAKENLNSSFLGIRLIATYKENFAGFIDFDLSTLSSMVQNFGAPYGESNKYSWFMGSNIVGLPSTAVNLNFPSRTYLVGGYDAFRVSVGRDKLSFGSGLMGNLLIGNTLPFHDYFEMAFTGSSWFGYTFLLDFFTYESNFGVSDRFPMNGVRFLILHRFDFSLLKGKLNFALNDSIMYASPDFYINPQALIPLYLLHSVFMAGNANSIATGEIEYAPIDNFSIYLQFGVDDLTMPNEPHFGKSNGASADGWGLMGGLRGTIPLKDDYFTLNAEFAYTSPFMYHRANYKYVDGVESGYEQNLYFVSSLRLVDTNAKGIFQYLSLPFGSDAIAGLLRFGYEKPSLWRGHFDAFFMAHGIIGKFSAIEYTSDLTGSYQNTPSTQNPFDPDEKGPVEYTMVFGGEAEWDVLSWLKLKGSLYLIGVLNKDNLSAPWVFDAQLGLGIVMTY